MSRVDYLDHMGNDLRVVNAARVSFDKWKEEFDTSDRNLIRYLAEHRHDSPFFHPQVCIRVETPIFVARQLFRHEVGGAKNEVSRRYVDDTPELEFPTEWRERPGAGRSKQGSGGLLPQGIQDQINSRIGHFAEHVIGLYDWMLSMGVAPEQARTVLPMALLTKWIWTCSLSFLSRVCRDRLAPEAQQETREVAVQIDAIVRELFPVSWPVLLGEMTSSRAVERERQP